jgi:hypothetical protein
MKTITGDRAATAGSEYYIVNDGGFEYLVKNDRDGRHLLLRSTDRKKVYAGILLNEGVCVREASAGEMLEGVFGQPKLSFGDFEPRKRPEAMFLVPPKPKEAGKKEGNSRSGFDGRSLEAYCQVHLRDKYKDGKTRGGKQKYRCPLCDRKEPAITDPSQANRGVRRRAGVGRVRGTKKAAKSGGSLWKSAQAASVASKVKRNPKCAACGERLRIGGRHRRKDGTLTTYWKCINKCPQRAEPDWKVWNAEQLREHFLEVVRKVNGHSPQDTPDIAHSMVTHLLEGTRSFGELHDPKVVRKFINSITRLSQDKHALLPLDAPVRRDEKAGLTFADQLETAAMNPEEELMAKETAEGEREG